MKFISFCIFFSLLIFSCQTDKKKENITQLVTEWQGKEIVFPKNIVFTRYLTDTTNYRVPDSDYKILVYVDSTGCTSCKLQLSKWKEWIAYTDSITGSKPLMIADVAVSCGCATASFDKRPASPGETLKVILDMTPKDSGFFSETITVKNEYIKIYSINH
jgi:hypothetical protein